LAAAATAAPATADSAASAAVSGSAVSAASTAAPAEPMQSIAAIRSPEPFVKAEGPATQVCYRAQVVWEVIGWSPAVSVVPCM
jgi:hypothetical protein